MIKVKAVKAFSGPDGRRDKGQVFEVPADRANWLTSNGFAERADSKEEPTLQVEPGKLAAAQVAVHVQEPSAKKSK